MRRVPRRRAGRGGGAGPARGRLPERLGWADDGRAVRIRARRDVPRLGEIAHRSGLPGARRVHPRCERGPARRRAADGRCGGRDRRCGGRGRGAARGRAGRAAAAAADAVRQPGGAARADPGHRRAARRPAARRLAELAADARQPRLQSAGPDHARQRRPVAARLGARHPRGQQPDDADRARRRDVPRESGELGAGDRRGRRRRHLAVSMAPARRCTPAGRDPHPRPLRRQGLPGHARRGPRRPRRADRGRGVARREGRLHAGLPPELRPRRRRRRRHQRHERVQPLQGADLLHHRARPQHRGGAVAHVHHRPPRRPERRLVGRHAAVSPGRRRLVDPGQLRSGPGPLLHRHRAGEAVGGGEPRHDDAAGRALHQLDARPEPAHGAGGVVLPARPGRDPRPRHRVRTGARRRRRRAVALHDRQGRHPLEARPAPPARSSTCARRSTRTSSSRSTGPPAS